MSDRRLFVYKCVVDNGGAPCVEDGLLTLTICKPYIRSTADKDDVVFAFGSNNDRVPNRLIYIAKINERMQTAAYFKEARFSRRADCIYKFQSDGRLAIRDQANFHAEGDNMASDVGEWPEYSLANALVSEDFRYFGSAGTDDWKMKAPHLKELVEHLGQGHRVNFSEALRDELMTLKKSIWRQYPHEQILGKPLHAADRCETKESDEVVKVCRRRCFSSSKGKPINQV